MNNICKKIENLNKRNDLSEDFLLNLFKNLSLNKSICDIAKISWTLDSFLSLDTLTNPQEETEINQYKAYVTQFILSYYINILIISGAHNNNYECFGNIDNYHKIMLGGLYYNQIDKPDTSNFNIIKYFIITHYEQFCNNIVPEYIFSRYYYFYKNIDEKFNIGLNSIFYEKTNISIELFYQISFILFILFEQKKDSLFNKDKMYLMLKEKLTSLTIEQFDNYLNILTIDTQFFKKSDRKLNSKFKYSKTKLNILSQYPIIKLGNNKYVIPSKNIFLKDGCDLYWYFDRLMDNNKFRDRYFDKIFEGYIGEILKYIFGEKNIRKITYKKNGTLCEFFDWVYEIDDTVYLFETKAYKFNITNIATGELKEQYFSKFAKKPIGQMYKRILDFESNQYNELDCLKSKKIVPIAIYYDIPFVSGSLYTGEINAVFKDKKDILEQELKINLEKINDFEYFLISMKDLEYFDSLYKKKSFSLLEFLEKVKNNNSLINACEKEIRELLNDDILSFEFLNNIVSEFIEIV